MKSRTSIPFSFFQSCSEDWDDNGTYDQVKNLIIENKQKE